MKKIILSFIVFAFVLFLSIGTTYAASSINNQSDLSPILAEWDGPEINITYDGIENTFKSDFNIEDYMIDNDGVAYYVSKDGLDTNDGLTLETAFLTLDEALAQSDVDTIFVDSGVYELSDDRLLADRLFNIIGLDDDVYLTGSESYAGWALTDTYTNTYEKVLTGSTVHSVRDISNSWDKYELVETIAAVEALEGSYYFDDVTDTVYVHAIGGLEPDENVQVVQFNVFNLSRTDAYFENVNIVAGSALIIAKKNSNLYLNNVNLMFSDGLTANGLTVQSSNAFLYNVESSYNMRDGLNYHNDDPTYLDNQYFVIEENVQSHHNGVDDVNTNNQGSSAHEDYKIIRVNSQYYNNNGSNIEDIGTTNSYGFGLTAYDSLTDVDFEKSDLNVSYLFNPISESLIGISDNINPFEIYYSITFQTQISSTIYSKFYQEDDSILLSSDPIRTGYTFDGWYEDSEFTTAFNLVEMPAERLVVYARWVPTPSSGSIISVDNNASLTFLGIAWYWWIAGIGVFYFGFTKKGRKTLGLKK